MLQATIRLSMVLARTRLKLFFNGLTASASSGRIIAGIMGVLLTILAVTSASSELIDTFRQIPFAELVIDWLLAILFIYCLFIVFTGDLLTGHTLGSGQMSQDFSYLSTLPIPSVSIIFIKLFERMLTDYLGVLILLSALIGITCRNGISLAPIALSLTLYIQISLMIGLLINLIMLFLQRFFRTATINNFFSLLGYISAFSTLVPYLIIANYTTDSLNWILNNYDWLNRTVFRLIIPARWVAVNLIEMNFRIEFLYFSAFWLASMSAGTLLFYTLIRLNWLTYSHSAAKKGGRVTRSFFKGFLRKETLLIKSDLNIAVNAVLMPITIIIAEIFFLKQVFSFSTPASVLNFIFGAIIYFCMFGPMNAIGLEGRAISLLETLPLQPSAILHRKFICWFFIALIIFIPSVTGTILYLGFATTMIIKSLVACMIFAAGCVWVTISLSAIFARFDSRVLQQRSTLTGKFSAMGIMLLAVPIKEPGWLNLLSAVIFLCLGELIFMKACRILFFRLDTQAQSSSSQMQTDYLLLLFIFVGLQTGIRQFFDAVIPGMDTGLWAWVMPIILITPAIILFASSLKKRETAPAAPSHKQTTCAQPAWAPTATAMAFSIAAILTLPLLDKFLPAKVALFKENAREFIYLTDRIIHTFDLSLTGYPNIFNLPAGEFMSLTAIFLITVFVFCSCTDFLAKLFLTPTTPNKNKAMALTGTLATAMIAPSLAVIPVTVFFIGLLVSFSSSGCHRALYLSAAFTISISINIWALFF